jgi:hypothetical protein
MTYYNHPIFGHIAVDPQDLTPEERAFHEVDRRNWQDFEARNEVSRKKELDFFLAELAKISVDEPADAVPVPAEAEAKAAHDLVVLTNDEISFITAETTPLIAAPKAEAAPIREIGGILHQRQPLGTVIVSGDTYMKDDDEIDYVWRPVNRIMQASSAPRVPTRYISQYDKTVQAHHDAQRECAEAIQNGASGLELAQAQVKVRQAEIARQRALKEADTPEVRYRDRVNAWRKESPDEYNAARRKKRSQPNIRLLGMSEEDKAAIKRAQTAKRVANHRARKAAQNFAE